MIGFCKALLATMAVAMAFLPVKAFSLEATGVLKRASDAMGATDLRSLRYVGTGRGILSGLTSVERGPELNLQRYVRSINYETASFSDEIMATPAEAQGGGAGVLPVGQSRGRRSITFVSGPYAWDVDGSMAISAAPDATSRTHQLWITPHGAIKAAIRNNATLEWNVRGGKSLAVVSFVEPGGVKATVYINDRFLVERVESGLERSQRGETMVVTGYSEYQSFGPIMFPMQIRQTAGGRTILDLTVRETQPNAPINISVPESLRSPR